ncbi:MAG TPA: hypothetical protein VF273_05890 [Pelobium sp.]
MKEQFDRALRNHIRDTFDHYDDQMADDGWRKFQQQKSRKKRGLILWYALPTGIAAALAFLWLFNLNGVETVKPGGVRPIAKNTITQPKRFPKENNSKQTSPVLLGTTSAPEPVASAKQSDSILSLPSENLTVNAEAKTSTVENLINVDQLYISQIINDGQKPNVLPRIDALKIKNEQFNTQDEDYLAFNPTLFAKTNAQPSNILKEDKDQEKKKNGRFNFAVDANTFYSFTSNGVNNDLNLGIGLLSELKLTKRLSINSGINLNRQSAVYQNDNPSSQSFAGLSSPSSLTSSLGKESISVPDEVRTGAKLVGFDIPINLKYNLPAGKFKSYISGGVSSYSLLNQSYVKDVSVVNYSLRGEPTTSVLRSVDKESDKAFSNFQFARTVNFAFGIVYPLSVKNSIAIEPFLKYPIAGFGSQDLEIGSGGISFKLNFGK